MELVWIAKGYRCKTYIGFQRLSIKKKILSNNFNIHYVLKFNLLKPACFKCHQNFTCFSMFFNAATRKQIYNLVCILFLLGSAALSPTWLLSFQFISESDWLHFHILPLILFLIPFSKTYLVSIELLSYSNRCGLNRLLWPISIPTSCHLM